jgi:hypothetical protein
MDDATKELCYLVKLAVIKAIINAIEQMPNEQVLKIIEKPVKEVNDENRRKLERETDERPHGKGTV